LDKEQYPQAVGEVEKVRNCRQASEQRQTTQFAYTDENVDAVKSLSMSQEDKPQSLRTVREISREVGSVGRQKTVFLQLGLFGL